MASLCGKIEKGVEDNYNSDGILVHLCHDYWPPPFEGTSKGILAIIEIFQRVIK